MADSLSTLDTQDGYVRLFTSVPFWTPYIQQVCRRHHLLPCEPVRIGVPGTCPAFIVNERWVVKFFGRLFEGGRAFAAEQEAGRLLALDPAIAAARVLGSGELGEGDSWPWPYIIFDYIPGASIGEVLGQLSLPDRLAAARHVGAAVRRLHALPLAGSPVFPNSPEPYLRFLAEQRAGVVERQRAWACSSGRGLPARLLDQIDAFMPPVETLINDTNRPHLIHADLTRDHLLGRFEDGSGSSPGGGPGIGRWVPLAIIDFGDARTGSLLYELGPLQLDMFGSDKRMLAAFLDAYGMPETARRALPIPALATALLHQFNVFEIVPEEILSGAETLEALAEALFAVDDVADGTCAANTTSAA